MIKKIFVAFQLDKAVEDVTRLNVEFSDYCFTLASLNKGFATEKEAEDFIDEKTKDYKNRGVDKGLRMVIIPVYVFEDDEQFMPEK